MDEKNPLISLSIDSWDQDSFAEVNPTLPFHIWSLGTEMIFFPPSSQTKCLNQATLEKDSEGSRILLLLFSHSVMSNSFLTPWTIACKVPLSMEFSRQEYWSGLPFPSLGDLPDPGTKPASLALQADSLLSKPPGTEKAMAPHSSVLAWKIPETGEPGGLLYMGLHRVGHDWSDLAAAASNLGSPQNPLQAQYRCRKWDPIRQTGLNLALNSDSSNF